MGSMAMNGIDDVANLASSQRHGIDPNTRLQEAAAEAHAYGKADTAAGGRAKHLTPVDDPYKATAVGTALGAANAVGGVTSLGLMFGVPVVTGVGKLTGWTGRKLNSDMLKSAGNAIQKPGKYLNETSVSEFVGKGRVGKAIRSGAQRVADGMAPMAEKIVSATGIREAMTNRKIQKAAVSHQKALALAGELNLSGLNVPAEVTAHLETMKNAVVGKASYAHVDHAAVNKAGMALEQALESGAVNKAQLKPAADFIKAAGKTTAHFEGANSWGKIGDGIKKMPKAMGQAKLGHFAVNGAFIGLSGLSVINDTRDFKSNLKALKIMFADLAGVDAKTVTTRQVFFGKVPKPVAEARSQLLKTFGVRQVMDVANIVLNVGQAVSRKFSGKLLFGAFMGVQAADMATNAILGQTALPLYMAFRNEYAKNNGELSSDYYAAFIGTFSQDLAKRGGPSNLFTQEIARQLAAEKASPADMLRMVSDGDIKRRVNELIKASEQKQAAGASAAAASHAPGKREAVGHHTAKEIKRQAQQTPGHGMSPA